MSDDWKKDKDATDIYMPHVRSIMGQVLLRDASEFEDQRENTDLRVLVVTGGRVAVRIRNERDRDKYGHQFTIRLSRPSGVTTELEKIAEGWGDFFFYGFGNGAKLTSYVVLDLARFRKRLVHNNPPVVQEDLTNQDGTRFRAYRVEDFAAAIVRKGTR